MKLWVFRLALLSFRVKKGDFALLINPQPLFNQLSTQMNVILLRTQWY